MKMDIPQGGKISKDAKECMQECASELLSFITSEYPSSVLEKQVHTQANQKLVSSATYICLAAPF